ncbi:MAG: von Willebrand factor type A domain-containing protein [Verrucomicrobiales bacterium]
MNTPITPREELEIKITALLMGQLPPEEAAQVQAQIAADTELAALHARLSRAAALVREARGMPGQPEPLKLSAEKREALLARFQGMQALPSPAVAPEKKPPRDWKWAIPMGLAASVIAMAGWVLLSMEWKVMSAGRRLAGNSAAEDPDDGRIFDGKSIVVRAFHDESARAPEHIAAFSAPQPQAAPIVVTATPPSQPAPRRANILPAQPMVASAKPADSPIYLPHAAPSRGETAESPVSVAVNGGEQFARDFSGLTSGTPGGEAAAGALAMSGQSAFGGAHVADNGPNQHSNANGEESKRESGLGAKDSIAQTPGPAAAELAGLDREVRSDVVPEAEHVEMSEPLLTAGRLITEEKFKSSIDSAQSQPDADADQSSDAAGNLMNRGFATRSSRDHWRYEEMDGDEPFRKADDKPAHGNPAHGNPAHNDLTYAAPDPAGAPMTESGGKLAQPQELTEAFFAKVETQKGLNRQVSNPTDAESADEKLGKLNSFGDAPAPEERDKVVATAEDTLTPRHGFSPYWEDVDGRVSVENNRRGIDAIAVPNLQLSRVEAEDEKKENGGLATGDAYYLSGPAALQSDRNLGALQGGDAQNGRARDHRMKAVRMTENALGDLTDGLRDTADAGVPETPEGETTGLAREWDGAVVAEAGLPVRGSLFSSRGASGRRPNLGADGFGINAPNASDAAQAPADAPERMKSLAKHEAASPSSDRFGSTLDAASSADGVSPEPAQPLEKALAHSNTEGRDSKARQSGREQEAEVTKEALPSDESAPRFINGDGTAETGKATHRSGSVANWNFDIDAGVSDPLRALVPAEKAKLSAPASGSVEGALDFRYKAEKPALDTNGAAVIPMEKSVKDFGVISLATSVASPSQVENAQGLISIPDLKAGSRLPEKAPAAEPELPVVEHAVASAPAAEPPAPPKALQPPPVPQPEVVTKDNAFSTFSLNVSDVSFKLAGASLEKGAMPDVASVRTEEFINALDYRDPQPAPGEPIAFAAERARYPFAHNRDLLRLSVKTAAEGREPERPLNLVLLLDNSGSMERADRVRILQESLAVLTKQLKPQDKLSIITFSRTPRLWADGVAADKAAEFAERVAEITPEGGTDLSAAMDLGYATVLKHYAVGSINRVVLLTDGAANLGDVNPAALKAKVESHRQQGVAFDCFGVGWEGYNDDLLEQLSRNGDGRYGFINTPADASTEFAGQLAGALRVAASDVKVQVEFNPARVTSYRQLGYAKHQLEKEQFRDNTVDAAEIGAAESGNALYTIEVNPAGTGDIATVRVRYKVPGTADYHEHEWPVPYNAPAPALENSSFSLRLATTAAAFAEFLGQSPFAAEVTTDRLLGMINGIPAIYGADPRPGKLEWMIRQAKSLSGR